MARFRFTPHFSQLSLTACGSVRARKLDGTLQSTTKHNSASKGAPAYQLAGARVGYGLANDALTAKQLREHCLNFNISSLNYAAALAAWRDRDTLADYLEHNRVEKAFLGAELGSWGCGFCLLRLILLRWRCLFQRSMCWRRCGRRRLLVRPGIMGILSGLFGLDWVYERIVKQWQDC